MFDAAFIFVAIFNYNLVLSLPFCTLLTELCLKDVGAVIWACTIWVSELTVVGVGTWHGDGCSAGTTGVFCSAGRVRMSAGGSLCVGT